MYVRTRTPRAHSARVEQSQREAGAVVARTDDVARATTLEQALVPAAITDERAAPVHAPPVPTIAAAHEATRGVKGGLGLGGINCLQSRQERRRSIRRSIWRSSPARRRRRLGVGHPSGCHPSLGSHHGHGGHSGRRFGVVGVRGHQVGGRAGGGPALLIEGLGEVLELLLA